MKQKIYDILKFLCYVWIGLFTFTIIIARFEDDLYHFGLRIILFLIFNTLPIIFVIWRYRRDEEIRAKRKKTKLESNQKAKEIIKSIKITREREKAAELAKKENERIEVQIQKGNELQILNTPEEVDGKYIYTFNKMMSYENSVIIDGSWIEIIRGKGIVNTLNHGLDGAKRIHIKHIAGVQLKEASNITNGYIQFLVIGSQENKGGLLAATQDENTIMFIKKYSDLAKKLVKDVQDKIEETDKSPGLVVQSNLSIAQQIKEFKELLDEGIITQAEFNIKKSELLKK